MHLLRLCGIRNLYSRQSPKCTAIPTALPRCRPFPDHPLSARICQTIRSDLQWSFVFYQQLPCTPVRDPCLHSAGSCPGPAVLSACSHSHLCRIIKKALHITPAALINQYRLHLAERLLTTQPSLSVTEIAFRGGFEDTSYFIRLFRKEKGITPGKLRTSLK